MSRSRVLRSPLGRVFYWILGGALIGLPLIVLLAVYAAGDPGPPPWGLVVGFAALILVGAFSVRMAMVRVVLHDDHVELVNPLRRFRFYWSDVEDIDIISSAGWIVRVWAGECPLGLGNVADRTVRRHPVRQRSRRSVEGRTEAGVRGLPRDARRLEARRDLAALSPPWPRSASSNSC